MKSEFFETPRLKLIPTSIEDKLFIYNLFNSDGWLKYIGDRGVNSVDDAERYIRKEMLPQLSQLGFSNYTVIRKIDNLKIGICGLFKREGLKDIDLGFAFFPEFGGNGYAFEAASILKNMAFKKFKLEKIVAITLSQNYSSQRLLEKLDFKFIQLIKLPDDNREWMLYSMYNTKD
ncbi:MAG: GNAT family N-acetyltransferase [Pseudooceanicola sp.]|nr:GNAT family N-acetyltransferase [Pseudooceanicola sp.]|tara:strand:+ start:572 stop:1096 length:525 start_codon:yes stop_codon:yes gene_type:complete